MTRVAFDGTCLADGPHTGVARALLDTLATFAREAPCWLLTPAGVDVAALGLPAQVEPVPSARGYVRKQATWPRLLRRLGARLLHAPVAAVPLGLPCPAVVTVHDLPWRAPLPLPASERQRLRHRLALRILARRAAAILVPSVATATDLRLELGARAASRVHVVPHGQPAVPPAPLADLLGPLVALGDDRPRKNRARVAQAHALALRRDPGLPELWFVGPPQRYVSEAEKDALLRRARGLVHLSLHEGFGLPVLEAMARGVPVLSSTAGGLRELTAGGAALTADPLDCAAMADAMVRLCRDDALRLALRERGLARARELSCAATAAHWHRIHGELLRGALLPRPA